MYKNDLVYIKSHIAKFQRHVDIVMLQYHKVSMDNYHNKICRNMQSILLSSYQLLCIDEFRCRLNTTRWSDIVQRYNVKLHNIYL